MPSIPDTSPATGAPVPPHFIHTTSGHFVDNTGRVLILRGVNLAGSGKTPVSQPSYVLDGFWESVEGGDGVSFVGRPFGDLEDGGEADRHLARLRGWGFGMLRYVFTWEALERKGPGQYDEEFIDYTIRVLQKCKAHGFKIYMDPHQDTWSRFTGGDGAPYWTLLACGINPRHITATQSAILHNEYPDPANPDPASIPAMIWGTNYARTACQTLFTLFFAGKDFAPKCIIDGMNIQEYLEGHFFRAVGYLASRIKASGDLLDECIIGWDSMNEPFEGYCGITDLRVIPPHQSLKKGSTPTPAEGLRLAMGQKQTVEWWDFGSFGPKRNGSVTIDPNGIKLWIDPDVADEDAAGTSLRWGWKRDPGWKLGECIWAMHGVWDPVSGDVTQPDYFARTPHDPTRPMEFLSDYWRTHWRHYINVIRTHHPEAIHFLQPPVFMAPPVLEDDDLRGRGCFSTHYYDGLTLLTRHWNWFNADALGVLRGKYSSPIFAVKIGEPAIRKSIQEQLGELRSDGLTILGDYPTILGEIGVPMDMDGKYSYGMDGGKGKGDYSRQTRALDASLNGADGPNALNYTIWTYVPDSNHKWGDRWNMEDLALWSSDDLRENRKDGLQRQRKLAREYAQSGKDGARMIVRSVDDDDTDGAQGDESAVPSASTSVVQLQDLLKTSALGSTTSLPRSDSSTTLTSATLFPKFADAATAFAFLTNGARAWKAFVRAYPLAMVGTPVNWDFDIHKAQFQLTVSVGSEDSKDGHDVTEIFVPLVHFAKDDVVRRALNPATTPIPLSGVSQPFANRSAFASASASKASLLAGERSKDSEAEADGLADSMAIQVIMTTPNNGPVPQDMRWEMNGQVLSWHYPTPPSTMEGRVQYSITIRRIGGAIDFARLGFGNMVGLSAEDGSAAIDQICGSGNGCVVM